MTLLAFLVTRPMTSSDEDLISASDEDSTTAPARSTNEQDVAEVSRLREYYQPWCNWTDRGILHDLKEIHHRPNPTRLLLLSIALGVSHELGIPIGRQEKRRRDLIVGWLNEHYSHVEGIIPELVLCDSRGPLSGPAEKLMQYRRDHPDDSDVAEIRRGVKR
jgi:hypothetical protein